MGCRVSTNVTNSTNIFYKLVGRGYEERDTALGVLPNIFLKLFDYSRVQVSFDQVYFHFTGYAQKV